MAVAGTTTAQGGGGGGVLEVNIVDAGGTLVGSPSVTMNSRPFSFNNQTATGNLGTASQKIRINNTTASAAWNLTIAATGGTTSFWESTSHSYDFNDSTANAGDGGDADSLGGRMTIDASNADITPQGGCNSTGLTLGSSSSFSEGVINSITLLTAGGGASTNCYWDLTNIAISQTVPSEQETGNYNIDMTLTATAI